MLPFSEFHAWFRRRIIPELAAYAHAMPTVHDCFKVTTLAAYAGRLEETSPQQFRTLIRPAPESRERQHHRFR